MNNKITIKGRTFATEHGCGVFELKHGAYKQHRGTAKCFSSTDTFRRYVRREIITDRDGLSQQDRRYLRRA